MDEGASLNSAQLQTALLRLLSGRGRQSFVPTLGGRQSFVPTLGNPQALTYTFAQEYPDAEPPASQEIMEALWSLVAQGLVYLNFYESHTSNWSFRLTSAGQAAANDQDINPDSPDEYLRRLQGNVPDASDTVMRYVTEALNSYLTRCYLASAVMLGVASEAAFLEMAEAFGRWLPPTEGTKFLTLIRKPNAAYLAKFEEYRKQLEPRKRDLPPELADGIALTLDAILDLLRIYRNDAGHPTGKQIAREQARLHLEMFAHYLERMYAFKAFFERPTT